MNTRWKLATVAGCVLSCALLVPRIGSADQLAAAEPGIWQKHEYSFAFMGFTSTYSCDGLADKLKILLIAAGARHDVKSLPGACASNYGRPDRFARANLTFYTLAPGDADAASGSKPIDGVWRPVSLADRSPRELGAGDCELVDQFRTSVLPMFATRNIENHTTCIPHQISGSTINLKFESFSAPPRRSHTAAAQPTAAQPAAAQPAGK
jgi:hypothetical protein